MTDRETLNASPDPQATIQSWISRVWYLWESNGGGHYATRRGRLTDHQMHVGYERTVPADNPEQLHALLLKQPDAPRVGKERA